jgi:hypothetical protein
VVSGENRSNERYLCVFKASINLRKRNVKRKVLKENIAQSRKVLRKIESCSGTSFERANELLRYGIACLQGKNIVSKVNGRVAIALHLKGRMEEEGQWWQARTLNFWIHRAQGGEFGE